MWRDQYYGGTMSKLLVIGIQKDQATRRNWEDRFAEELQRQGVTAVASYKLFPAEVPDTQVVVQTVRSEGYDGVLMARPLGAADETKWVPGYIREVPALQYEPWYGIYYNHYRRMYEPGYVETYSAARYKIYLWSALNPERVVWTGTTESVDPTSVDQVNQEISKKIVPELMEQKVLASR